MLRVFPTVHRTLYRWSNGRLGGSAPMGGELLLLTTTGRKTSQPRTMPLLYVKHGDELMVVGSNSGLDTHPGWYWNLQADPTATIQIGADTRTVVARVAAGDERDRLWIDLVDRYPGYGKYAEKTDREIPLVLLAPVPEGAEL